MLANLKINTVKRLKNSALNNPVVQITRQHPCRLKIQNDTKQDIMSDAEIFAAVTVNEKMSENEEDVNVEDTLQTP
ncbi:hypothetical protein TNCV_1209041 [Trichonephila clavipes]|nr:hypothetical protein TNCV_1209041 [Trichonephila clavipes]